MAKKLDHRLGRLHELADELKQGIKRSNHPMPEGFSTDLVESLVEVLKEIDKLETPDERQTLVYAQAKLREMRRSLRDGPFEIQRLHNALFAEVDELLTDLPQPELVPLAPSPTEPSLIIKRDEIVSKVEALERLLDRMAEESQQTIILIDQSERQEFNLIRIDLEALIKNAATFKTELVATLIDLRWLTKFVERVSEISKSLSASIKSVRKTLGQLAAIEVSLDGVRNLSQRVINGTRSLIRTIRRRLKPTDENSKAASQAHSELCIPELVTIPAGTFLMGSPKGRVARSDTESPQYDVIFERSFALGRYPVTFDEYDYFCSQTGREAAEDAGWGRGRRPVIKVSWEDAQDYCNWLSAATGQSFRLPTEAEWEYACRAGTTTRYAFGDEMTEEQANFGGVIGKTTEVGSYPANAWDVYDMHGNVWEWVEDYWHETYENAPNNGSARTMGESTRRVMRGGSWYDGAVNLRSACRGRNRPVYRDDDTGFRVARVLAP